MTGALEAGNKILANTGLVSMHGKERDRESILKEDAYQGFDEIRVERNLDWVAGDEIYLAPTNMQWTHSEYRTIVDYNVDTGIITLDEPLDFYHFGDDYTTGDDFNGLDMRGEVKLLTRNIKIEGED